MSKTKINFNNAQRSYLARLFDDTLRDENVYLAMGATTKSLLQESIRLFFTPFKRIDPHLPPVEVDVEEVKDDDGNVVQVFYTVDLILDIPGLSKYKEFQLPLRKKINKSTLDYVR